MSKYSFSVDPQDVEFIRSKNRLIQSKIPAPGTKNLLERLNQVESRSMHGQLPIVWSRAEGFNIFDIAGNCWIDFTSTIFVANVGHSNANVANSIKNTLDNPLLSCYAYTNPIRADYLEKLIAFSGKPFEKAFLLSAGTEATEAALKLMRMHGQKISKKRLGIIAIENNWHGRTLGAQMMSSNKTQREWIGFQDKDIHHIPFPYPWDLKEISGKDFLIKALAKLKDKGIDLRSDICGFMLETFQGWGAIFYPKDFVQEIYKVCQENNILLTFDEMQSGFGRTGKKFGFEHYEVEPDLICTGKGMGGGVPLSGVIGTAKIMDLPDTGNMSSTHSANPLVCAAGLAVLNEIENKNLIQNTNKKSIILFKGLKELKQKYPDRVEYIFGKGLIAAILFKEPKTNAPDSYFTSMVAERCMQKGLLVVHTGRESIKIGPPLIISEGALNEGIKVLDESINEIILEKGSKVD
tara:strand:+ start:70 stop:1464 length:1395 start_codon:yes stop_codon:yes gene_type:complete